MKNTENRTNSIFSGDMQRLISDWKYGDMLKGKSIMITGATGLIARYLTSFLLEMNRQKHAGIKVLALARNMEKAENCFSSYLDDELFTIVNQDVCEPIITDAKADYIFHAAGSASASAIRTNPVGIIRANTIGTINIMDYAVKSGSEKVVFASTREIYGRISDISSISEKDMGITDPLESRNCYPESKRMAEAICESYRQQYGIGYSVLRIAHTYGPTMQLEGDGRVMADFIEAVVNGHDILLNSDGTAIRAFCYVTDTVQGIMDVMFKGESGGAYNLANEEEPYQIRDVARQLTEMYPERQLKVVFANPDDSVKKGYLGYKIVKLDTSKLESLGWKPAVGLSEGMKRTVDYFIEERECE